MSSATGRMIKAARQAAGMSQAELARRLGVSQPMVSIYESGAREPSVVTLRRFARGLGLQVSLTPAPETGRPSPEEAGRQLEDVLSLVDAFAFVRADDRLRFPVLARL